MYVYTYIYIYIYTHIYIYIYIYRERDIDVDMYIISGGHVGARDPGALVQLPECRVLRFIYLFIDYDITIGTRSVITSLI